MIVQQKHIRICFKQVLLKDTMVNQYLTEANIDHILNPKEYVGLAPIMARDMVALSRKEIEKDCLIMEANIYNEIPTPGYVLLGGDNSPGRQIK